MKIAALTLAALMTIASAPTSAARFEQAGVSHCSTRSTVSFLKAGDPNFREVVQQLNDYFGLGPFVGVPKVKPLDATVVPASATTLRVDVRTKVCSKPGSKSSGQDVGIMNTCEELGCVDDLGPYYSNLPTGSQVKITSCGNNVEVSRRYTKDDNGDWVLVAYSSVMVDECRIE